MNKTKITLTPAQFYLVQGEYEGFKYYQLWLETDEGLTLKKKLTQFEYNTLIENCGD